MKRLFILLPIMAGFLQGCVPVALVAGGAAAGSSLVSDQRNMQTIADDQDLTYQANMRLSTDKKINEGAHVTATVFNHVLLLTGQAPREDLKLRAEKLVQALPKIRKIYNQIVIAQPIGSFQRSDDSLLTTNIRTRLLTTNDLRSNQFKVVTENHVVYLMGLSSRQQAAMAVDVIRHSSGVKKVVKLVEYTD